MLRHLVSIVVLEHALILQQCLAIEPTRKYFYGFQANDPYGDLKLRRQFGRKKEQISLKPPPEDWPAPTMGPADFQVVETPVVTSISPLHAYQAQLEKEFLEQQQEKALRERASTEPPVTPSAWSSSEEELKKLLDPNELVKHNKKLRPFINRALTEKSVGKQGSEASKTAESVTKPATVDGKKAVTRKRRRKSKMASSKLTAKPRRGRKKKENKDDDLSSPKVLKESKKRKEKLKTISSEKPLKSKRKAMRVKKFTFAGNYQQGEDEKDIENPKKLTTAREEELTTVEEFPGTTTSYLNEMTQLAATESFEKKSEEQTTSPMKEQISTTTESVTPTETVTASPTTMATSTSDSLKTFLRDNREEIREKRKRVREEMEKILKAEKLDSFSDRDSHWTTSEKGKISILNVTPRIALMELLKHRIIHYVDDIVGKSPKLTEEEQRLHEEMYTSWNKTSKS